MKPEADLALGQQRFAPEVEVGQQEMLGIALAAELDAGLGADAAVRSFAADQPAPSPLFLRPGGVPEPRLDRAGALGMLHELRGPLDRPSPELAEEVAEEGLGTALRDQQRARLEGAAGAGVAELGVEPDLEQLALSQVEVDGARRAALLDEAVHDPHRREQLGDPILQPDGVRCRGGSRLAIDQPGVEAELGAAAGERQSRGAGAHDQQLAAATSGRRRRWRRGFSARLPRVVRSRDLVWLCDHDRHHSHREWMNEPRRFARSERPISRCRRRGSDRRRWLANRRPEGPRRRRAGGRPESAVSRCCHRSNGR